ncbi:MAG: glycosyltransferase family 4 protein [Planctomycetaceae bacterium]|nr:glycosyltransferase family 4 protein [Planctomycetaceae bacterium]
MRVIALIEKPDHVCYRYRLEAFIPELWERGCTLEAAPLARSWLGRLRQLRSLAAADVVILQRKLLPLLQLAVLRRSARKLIYDFDDAVYHRDSFARKGIPSRQRMGQFWATVSAADGVIAGNAFLAQQARQFVDSERVHVVPTCVRPELYEPAAHAARRGSTRLVWIGQPSTLRGLEQARPHFAAVARRVPGAELHVVCSEFPHFDPLRVVPRPWTQSGEADELTRCDIGVSWLPDDAWSRGKCGLKVLQYLAAGLPVVANPVGIQADLVRPGVTGFLAETPAEWATAVATLAADPQLRRQMGAAGRALVEREYSERITARKFVDVVARVTGRELSPVRWEPARPSERPRATSPSSPQLPVPQLTGEPSTW